MVVVNKMYVYLCSLTLVFLAIMPFELCDPLCFLQSPVDLRSPGTLLLR